MSIFDLTPLIPELGKPTELILSVTDQKLDDPITKFEVLHDKLMHVIIVAEDLSYFAHIHPEIKDIDDNTRFTISHTFPESSKYKLWVDFKPKDGNQTLAAFKFNVTGHSPHTSEDLVYDGKYTKESLDGQYLIRLNIPDNIVAQNDIDFAYSMSDSSGQPITNLQPLMAAGGHCVIISSDLKEFLHVRPTEEVGTNWCGGPNISFKTNFPKPGLYKTWGQFQHRGKAITTEGFILKVE